MFALELKFMKTHKITMYKTNKVNSKQMDQYLNVPEGTPKNCACDVDVSQTLDIALHTHFHAALRHMYLR